MIEKIYAYSKGKKIPKKYAFLSPPTATNSLSQTNQNIINKKYL